MKIFWGVRVCIVFVSAGISIAQTDTTAVDIDDLLEIISPPEEIERGENENYDFLEQIYRNPINLNTADLYELQRIPFIDFNTAQKIIGYRSNYGRFFSKSELYNINSISQELIRQILDFVTVASYSIIPQKQILMKSEESVVHLTFRSRVINNMNDEFVQNKYAGNSLKLYNRLNMQYGLASIGLLTEKDPGENKFYDFNSIYLQIKSLYFIDKLVLGDYNLKIGQGIIASGPYGVVKSSEAIIPVKKGKEIIMPYESVQENLFFRGAAVKLNLTFLDLLFFYSQKQIDAIIDSSGNITSIPADGYHRTQTEISRRNIAGETCLGAGVNYYFKEIFQVQLFHFRSRFSHQRISDAFRKKEIDFTSVSYDITANRMNIYGETGYDGNSVATINHFFFPISKELKFINCVRWYPGFISIYGNSFAEQKSIFKNETGFYSGLNYKSPAGYFNIYYDQFILANSGLSLQGRDWFVGYKFIINQTEICFSYHNKNKENINPENKIYKELRQNYTIELKLKINKNLNSRTRFQYKHSFDQLNQDPSEGYLFYYDIYYHVTNFQLYGRIILFDTDDFDSAIYEYENNLPGIFQNLALYESGLRWYFLLRYKITEWFSFSLKYSETYKQTNILYPNNGSITDDQLGVQTEFTF